MFYKIKGIIQNNCCELSINSTIAGNNPGKIFVDSMEYPESVLIKTVECNVVAGKADNNEFNNAIRKELNFWDHLTCDTMEWEKHINEFHSNSFLKKYKRKYYLLTSLNFKDYKECLENNVWIEQIDAHIINNIKLQNSDKVKEWVDGNWFSVKQFLKSGFGFCIRNKNEIISWCITDCYFEDRIEIGIHTDDKYKRKGYGSIAVAATVEACLSSGINTIGWHCVGKNTGSIKTAEKVGFKLEKEYYSFTPYPPIENDSDLTADEWEDYAIFYNKASNEESKYYWLTAECWAKANNVNNTIKILKNILDSGQKINPYYINDADIFEKFKTNDKWNNFKNEIKKLYPNTLQGLNKI